MLKTGKVRIYRYIVRLPSYELADSHLTPVVKYEKAAFEIEGQDTIFTCLAWLSSNLIAVGCANGFVAIFDLQHDPGAGE
jgi:hypothetical protein